MAKKENIIEEIAHETEKVIKKGMKKAEEIVEETVEGAENIVKKAGERAEQLIESKEISHKKDPDNEKDKSEKKEKKPKSKLEELKEKAKALEGKFKETDKKGIKEIKEEVTGEKEAKKDVLVPIEDYLKASIHLGTRVITPHMRPYVYRRRADGLAVFNTDLLDDKIKEAADYLAGFAPEDIVLVCKREAGWKAAQKFAGTFGIRSFTKKYPAGILTNTNLKDFFEAELVFICDPWLDKNALTDANKIKIPVLAVCDTNNYTFGINKILPGNNKSAKSLGIIFYLLTKLYAEKRKIKIEEPKVEDYIDDWANLQPPK